MAPRPKLLGWSTTNQRPARAASGAAPPIHACDLARAEQLARASSPFEWAEVAWDLCDAGEPLVAAAFWEAVLRRYDCDPRVHLFHADALDAAGALEAALAAARRGHELDPSAYEFHEVILDLLFALGRSEHSFAWKEAPQVVRLGAATRDRIALYVKEEGECDLFDLRYTLFDGQYVCFDVADLAHELEKDPRFEVCHFEAAAFISLAEAKTREDGPA